MDGPRRRCAGGSGCRREWQCGSPTARLDGMDWMEFGWHVARWQGWEPGDGGKWRVQCGYGATILKAAALMRQWLRHTWRERGTRQHVNRCRVGVEVAAEKDGRTTRRNTRVWGDGTGSGCEADRVVQASSQIAPIGAGLFRLH